MSASATSTPALPFDARFATHLRARKQDFVTEHPSGSEIAQYGAATIAMNGWPGWPPELDSTTSITGTESIIETYVASPAAIAATSDNEPFVRLWLPAVEWLNQTIRRSLSEHDVEVDGDAYITASVTPTASLEGTAHMDDATFMPAESVGIVAIVGQHVGPRVAWGSLTPLPFRPTGQVVWQDGQLDDFENGRLDHNAAAADQLVISPQFGQLHAGPAAHHVAKLAPTRQLLVYRATVR